MCSAILVRIRLFFFTLTLVSFFFIAQASGLYAQAEQSVCYSQPEMTEKELRQGVKAMQDIIELKGSLSPEEEENIIRVRKLTSERLNCLMGKLMAANDIFDWGRAEDYGVPLTDKEKKIAVKYQKDSLMLKRYMEDVLNVRVE